MDMKRFFLYFITIAALALAGCGGGGGGSSTSPMTDGNGNGNGNGTPTAAEMTVADVIAALNLTDDADSDAIVAAIVNLETMASTAGTDRDMYKGMVAALRTMVNTALGAAATDDLAADVMTLVSAYADAKAVVDKAAAAGASSLAEGFLYALAGRDAPANTNDQFTLAPTMTTMKLEADGLAVSLNAAEDGDSMFAKSADKQGAAPDLGGMWNKTVVENDPVAEATTFDVAAVYSDAQGELPKSLILDEGGMSTDKSFMIENAADFNMMGNGVAGGAPIAPQAGATTTTRLGTPVAPIAGNARLEFAGTWRGIPGTFICTASDCNDNATDGMEITATTDADGETTYTAAFDDAWVFAPDNAMATIMKHDEDYLYLGWWHRVPTEGATDGTTNPHGFVAFAGGSDGFTDAGTAINELEGDAVYSGVATGKYAQQSGTLLNPAFIADAFTATATLTAKFGTDEAPGSISGAITGFNNSAGQSMAGWKVTMESINLVNGMADFDGGTAVAEIDGAKSTTGAWAGAFYGNGRDDGEPGSAAGTFSAEYGVNNTGEHTALSGAYGVHNTSADE